MRTGFFFYRRRYAQPKMAYILLGVIGIGLLVSLFLAAARLRPILESMATTRVSNTVNRIVSEAVNEAVENREFSYDHLITFEKDLDGRITAVHSNMAEFNRLQSKILDIVLTRIDQVSAKELSIPIGTLTGMALLAGRGPRIFVRMESLGSSSAWFENEFSSAGINQTKHRIVLNIDVFVSILLPGFIAATEVSNAVTVAETIIVGTVPDTYTYFHSAASGDYADWKDYFMKNS